MYVSIAEQAMGIERAPVKGVGRFWPRTMQRSVKKCNVDTVVT